MGKRKALKLLYLGTSVVFNVLGIVQLIIHLLLGK